MNPNLRKGNTTGHSVVGRWGFLGRIRDAFLLLLSLILQETSVGIVKQWIEHGKIIY